MTFDTTGFTSGAWDFRMADFDSSAAASKYVEFGSGSDFFPTVTNGQISIVPEPAAGALLAGLGLLAWAAARKKRLE